jgi:hypothetical protein
MLLFNVSLPFSLISFNLTIPVWRTSYISRLTVVFVNGELLTLSICALTGAYLFCSLRISGAINIYSLGLSYSSATSSSAIFNLLPVVAFFLAVLFG